MFYIIDIIGTIAFAISGVLVAMEKKMDPFGILIIAFVTAIGGGTLRDVLIGETPVSWMVNMTYTYVIIVAAVLAVLFRRKINYLRTSLFLFDTIGIGFFTVVGVEKGLSVGLHPIICIALGTISACFGGVIRDILCNEIPVIFRKEIYATACILGGLTYFLIRKFPIDENVVFVIAGIVVIVIRLLAVKFKISLPTVYHNK
ncbi:trimeric intracellular cation channel family protein [Oceanihabitans sediminis]|uniref:Trimeric intracellular cation channel family protein n=1 Tax=Oceanihabitans sediminis TaxID=1812012 RepID=A0A368P2J0_9FLAO|nr:trimeric intracellular cation channel family protein [Oceanihabitans sediminis]MDX1277415.1 trimeric intracellular cation channel family protein [Oceanihabitans sediminis]MDX1774212.1 trimeric intracellular cation channel family protein [Oceanihabitans sediminis]RBP30778.1 putative membrane protein YeiH [Oceanihabitans sediminis]RCU56748.1 trimeric intracellular cation channel family protein [Oceanihabitans sediminis]